VGRAPSISAQIAFSQLNQEKCGKGGVSISRARASKICASLPPAGACQAIHDQLESM
jgi:hypothetical protein